MHRDRRTPYLRLAAIPLSLLLLFLVGGPAAAQDSGEEGAEEKPNNKLKWSTASEVDNFGYDIYRALDEEGPFERITARPLPGHGTTDETSHYEFIDDAIDPTRTYYYYVESISVDGVRERFTPVIKAKAKQPAPGDEAKEDTESSPEGRR
ncbi:MAG: hypothetical protein AAGN66_08480 [Acidobacteriota bacterium]